MAEFVAMLRELKERSGRTLRGLEEHAAARGEVLARSTVADMLRKDSLPRPELLAVYLRACGVEQPAAWLRARERLATGVRDAVAVPEQPASPGPRWRRPSTVLAVVVVAVLVVAGVLFLRGDAPDAGTAPGASTAPDTGTTSDTSTAPGHGLPDLVAAGSRVGIHAADVPELCLTEGVDSTGRYHAAVAALRPCDGPGPKVSLHPVVGEYVTIKWEHPDHGIGCLTVLRSGAAEHLLEPWEQCSADNLDQLFRVERVRDERVRFRSAAGPLCVGLRTGSVVEGAEAVREQCADEPDQEFTIDFTPAGR